MNNPSRSKRIGFFILIICLIFLGFRAGSYLSRYFPVQAADLSIASVQHEDTPAQVTLSSPVHDIISSCCAATKSGAV